MILTNKGITLLFCFLFTAINGLQSQDYVTDLRKANELLSVAQERDRVAAEALEDVKSRRIRLEEDLQDANENPKSVSNVEKKKLETDIKSLRKKEDDLQKRRKYANNLLLDVTDILQTTPKKRTKFITTYEKHFGEIKLREDADYQPVRVSDDRPFIDKKQEVTKPVVTQSTNNSTIKELENQSETRPQPFLGIDVIADSPEKPVATTDKKTKKESKKKTVAEVEKKPKKAVAKTDEMSKKTETKPPSTKKSKKESESKAKVQNDTIATKPEPKTKTQKKKKGALVAMTRPETSKVSLNYKKYDPKEEAIFTTASTLDCNLAFNGLDNFTGKKKQETTPITLFAHTDDFMRAAMKDKDFVTCEATATRVEGSRIVYLNLVITIQTKDAQRTFGFLDRGAFIIFRLINGKKITLPTSKTDIGVVDALKGTTTFRAQLAIAEMLDLTQSELDVIRVSWSVGYEDYEIYDMEILRNLFKCLDKK